MSFVEFLYNRFCKIDKKQADQIKQIETIITIDTAQHVPPVISAKIIELDEIVVATVSELTAKLTALDNELKELSVRLETLEKNNIPFK